MPHFRYPEYSTSERQRGLMADKRVSELPRQGFNVVAHRLRLGLKRVWVNPDS